jgi:DNA-binding NarL/FixJ family response regulator
MLVKRPRVVLADDNKAILESVRRLLISDFDVVATVHDGRQAFDAVMALRPEAVVLDISMPCSSGLDVAKRLSALPDPPRIVFLTVHEGADFLAAAREAGASGYVVKRNAGRDLIHVLKQTLCGHRAFPEAELRRKARFRPELGLPQGGAAAALSRPSARSATAGPLEQTQGARRQGRRLVRLACWVDLSVNVERGPVTGEVLSKPTD